MPRYDYICPCGRTHERTLSIKSEPSTRLRCPGCGKRRARRQIGGGGNQHRGDLARARMFSKYPVVSNRLPFRMNVPGVDIQHAGPLGKCVIESRGHEKRVYERAGYVRGD